MAQKLASRLSALVAVALLAQPLLSETAHADRVGLFKTKEGVSVRYHVVTPFPYVKTKAYPALIAFPGGQQDSEAVKAAVDDYFGPEARKRGYLVFVPEAPNGYLFYGRGVFLAPELIEHFKKDFNIKGDKFDMAGYSNGGLSAFRIALKNRSRIRSLTVFPGYPAFTRDYLRLTRLKKVKINMFVNEADVRWKEIMDFTDERLKVLGIDVQYKVLKGKGHQVDALTGANAKVLLDAIAR